MNAPRMYLLVGPPGRPLGFELRVGDLVQRLTFSEVTSHGGLIERWLGVEPIRRLEERVEAGEAEAACRLQEITEAAQQLIGTVPALLHIAAVLVERHRRGSAPPAGAGVARTETGERSVEGPSRDAADAPRTGVQ